MFWFYLTAAVCVPAVLFFLWFKWLLAHAPIIDDEDWDD